ncbi:MAG: hypothetical protein NTX61_04595 [Bacteroidetes bacterium]|nr:hypothetical protein [Bacteroidota bacterium]
MQISNPKLSEREIAEAWAKITIQLWRKNMSRMKIAQNSSGDLYRSFKFKVIAASGGNVDRIEFAFNYYGKFLDMGVGKGTKLGDRPVSKGSRVLADKMLGGVRKPKKWYSRTFYGEAHRLFEILQKEYGRQVQVVISENINDNAIK